jgi:uncharacterized protein YjbJ (UPF0337 family)
MERDMEARWTQVKGKVREFWGEFTGDDVDWIAGRRDRLIGQLEQKYGMSRAEAERQVDEFIERII